MGNIVQNFIIKNCQDLRATKRASSMTDVWCDGIKHILICSTPKVPRRFIILNIKFIILKIKFKWHLLILVYKYSINILVTNKKALQMSILLLKF